MQLAHSIGLDASQTASPLEGERESFSLDILSHRNNLPAADDDGAADHHDDLLSCCT
jgi:hypothetical protein